VREGTQGFFLRSGLEGKNSLSVLKPCETAGAGSPPWRLKSISMSADSCSSNLAGRSMALTASGRLPE
jgi:hypothetical protein